MEAIYIVPLPLSLWWREEVPGAPGTWRPSTDTPPVPWFSRDSSRCRRDHQETHPKRYMPLQNPSTHSPHTSNTILRPNGQVSSGRTRRGLPAGDAGPGPQETPYQSFFPGRYRMNFVVFPFLLKQALTWKVHSETMKIKQSGSVSLAVRTDEFRVSLEILDLFKL
jgi:hypothetical protein